MSRFAPVGELARRAGVQLLVGAIVALAIVYLPMSSFVRKAETAEAMASVGWGAADGFLPLTWKVAFAIVGLLIVGVVYWGFDAPRRAVIVVGLLSIVAVYVAVNYGRGIKPLFAVVPALGAAIALTIWHDRWLGDYAEDD